MLIFSWLSKDTSRARCWKEAGFTTHSGQEYWNPGGRCVHTWSYVRIRTESSGNWQTGCVNNACCSCWKLQAWQFIRSSSSAAIRVLAIIEIMRPISELTCARPLTFDSPLIYDADFCLVCMDDVWILRLSDLKALDNPSDCPFSLHQLIMWVGVVRNLQSHGHVTCCPASAFRETMV